jgi:hypothetical protein
MENTFRLEFNEKQQHFHLDNFTHEENTHGWITVYKNCTTLEFKIFESYVNRVPKVKHTKESVLKSAIEVKGFIRNLLEYNLSITKC